MPDQIMPDQIDMGCVSTEVSGAIGTLTIDNPSRHNAVSLAMWKAIPAAVARLAGDPAVRVVLVRGGGTGAFVSGADISEFAVVRRDAATSRAYEAANGAAFAALRLCPKPTIAMIRRFCMGGGIGLAVACDMRIASDDALFAIPAARLGLAYPADAVKDVVDLIGASNAKDLFYTARRLDAAEALRLGLINRLVPVDKLETETAALLATIADNAPFTIGAVKAAIDAHRAPLSADWDQVHALAERCFDSADYAEGCAAFMAKRPPHFTGH